MSKFNYFAIILLIINSLIINLNLANQHFTLIVPSYNNSKYVQRNLDSIFKQTYHNYQVIYINDASTDDTETQVLSYLQKAAPTWLNFHYIRNQTNLGAGYNRYMGIHLSDPNSVIFFIDGDDWLVHPQVLETINQIYQDPHVWLTYGQFVTTLGQRSLPIQTNINTNFRKVDWAFWHPRTFRSALLKKIKLQDFLYEGRFLPSASDLAESFPALEMANGHIKCLNQILYVYNLHPNNDFRIDLKKQLFFENHCRSLKPYKKLATLTNKPANHTKYHILNSSTIVPGLNLDQDLAELLNILKQTHTKILIMTEPPANGKLVDLSFMSQKFKIQALDQRATNQAKINYTDQFTIIKNQKNNFESNNLFTHASIVIFAQAKTEFLDL